MIKHIVVYTFKEGVDKTEAVKTVAHALEPLVGKIPGLSTMQIRPCYQGGMDCCLYSEFESRESLQNYAAHPAHLAAKEHFWHFLDTRVCADYDL